MNPPYNARDRPVAVFMPWLTNSMKSIFYERKIHMKNITKAIALCLALLLCLSFPISASALEVNNTTIDTDVKGSLTIYKVDLTNAEKDGVWDWGCDVPKDIYDGLSPKAMPAEQGRAGSVLCDQYPSGDY